MAGTVGPPLPGTDMRFEAVPEMNYDPMGDPPKGEILFRSANVFSGYHREPQKTQEVTALAGNIFGLCVAITMVNISFQPVPARRSV